MINRAVIGDRGQVGNIPPVCCGQDIPHKAGVAREAHPLNTRPPFTLFTVCTQGGHRHSVGNSGIS
jgi:hypothetical protein